MYNISWYILLIPYTNHFKDTCPASCMTCESGGSSDGGLPIDSNGVCKYFCSSRYSRIRGVSVGYCGNGETYRTGDDCSGCRALGNF